MATVKVNFEDQGQDLLFFVIDTTALLVTEADHITMISTKIHR